MNLDYNNPIHRIGLAAMADEMILFKETEQEGIAIIDKLNEGDYVKSKMMELIAEIDLLKKQNESLLKELEARPVVVQ